MRFCSQQRTRGVGTLLPIRPKIPVSLKTGFRVLGSYKNPDWQLDLQVSDSASSCRRVWCPRQSLRPKLARKFRNYFLRREILPYYQSVRAAQHILVTANLEIRFRRSTWQARICCLDTRTRVDRSYPFICLKYVSQTFVSRSMGVESPEESALSRRFSRNIRTDSLDAAFDCRIINSSSGFDPISASAAQPP